MGDNNDITWAQRLAAWLEKPLTKKRVHQPAIYKAANAAAMTGAYGWATYAFATTMGWWGIPVYLALSSACSLVYRRYLKHHTDEITPHAKTKTSIAQAVTMVLPLSEDIGQTFLRQTFLRQTGHAHNCTIGFNEKTSYCHIVSADNKNYSIALAPDQVIGHYEGRHQDMGAAEGTALFIRELAGVMAHEKTHMGRPLWSRFTNYSVLKLGALVAAPIAAVLAVAGAPVAMPGIATTLMAMGSAGAVWLCQGIAARTEEYRADRGAVEQFGTAEHLSQMFSSRTPSLKRTFKTLFASHPTFTQRVAAMRQHEAELTPLERAGGAVSMAKLYTEIAARHAHMFVEKPAAATPEGILQPVRHATRALA